MLMVLFFYMTVYQDRAKKALWFFPFFFFLNFFLSGRGAWDKRMKEESRGNWILVGTAVPSCKNWGRNTFIVLGETK